ncbi:MAG: hypothetical protein HC942_17590 [Microcoleus sp. SU_5_6]|nr:hypothetical protein [Microcoleus sp. SU_5_6]
MQLLFLLIGFGGGAIVCWLILNKQISRSLVRGEGAQQAVLQLQSELTAKNSELQQKNRRKIG